MSTSRIKEFQNIYKKANKLDEGLFHSGYDYTMSKGDRQYVMQTKNGISSDRISKKFLNLIGASQELKDKFSEFEEEYGKMPQFFYTTRLNSTREKSKIEFQKTISVNGKKHDVSNYFTKEDTDELVDKWIDTYERASKENDIYKGTPEAAIENVIDFAKKNALGIGCAVFGVAALAVTIPAISNVYKSNQDIRDAVKHYMNSVDWSKEDNGKLGMNLGYGVTKSNFDVYANYRNGNKDEAKEIFTAVAKYAKKHDTTVNEAFHFLDGKKSKDLDTYNFDILEDNDGVLTIRLWSTTGKPKTIEVDTNTYQTIGNATFSWQESIKNKRRSNSYKENSRDDYNRRQRSIDRENRNTESLGNFMDAMDNDGRFIRGFFEWSEDCYNWGCEVDTDTHIVVTTAYDTSSARVTLYDTTTGETILDEDMVPRNYDKVIAACKRMTSNGDYYDFSDLEDDE